MVPGRSPRPVFPLLLAACALILVLGIVLALLMDSALMMILGSALIVGAWIVPALFAVRYRTKAQFRKTASAEDVRRAQRTIAAGIKQVQQQMSRTDNRHARTLKRLESNTRRIEVLAGEADTPLLRPQLDVLFITSNGVGLGHVSRLLAIAEQLPAGRTYELLTLSAAYRQVSAPGLTVHYFPSSGATGESPSRWNRLFAAHLRELITARRPRLVVFDGTWVYTGLTEVCRAFAIPLVWVQRGMWKVEVDESSTQRHSARDVVDEVIIPGDYAADEVVESGPGITTAQVGPIVRTTRDELMGRVEACRALGLDPSSRYVLLNLGSGALEEGESVREIAIRVLGEQMPDAQIVQVVSPLASPPVEHESVRNVSAYPVMPFVRAFDLMIAAAGYNTAQEAVSLQVPTVLVPNENTRTDDQLRRAEGLARQGLALSASTPQEITAAITRCAEERNLDSLRKALGLVHEARGATEAAELLEALLRSTEWIDRAETIYG